MADYDDRRVGHCRDLLPDRQETPDGSLARREVLVHKSSLLISFGKKT
jgi:hypothetical protein